MMKRIGAALILIENKKSVDKLNEIISEHSGIVLGRQGIPLRDKGISIISLILEGSSDKLNSLTGNIGRLEGIQVKMVLTKYQ